MYRDSTLDHEEGNDKMEEEEQCLNMLEVQPGLNIMIFETFSGWKCGSEKKWLKNSSAVAEFS